MVSDGTVQLINVNHHVYTVGRTIKLEICLTHLFSAKFHGINLAILLLLNLFFVITVYVKKLTLMLTGIAR